jgi:hypothetical protein
MFPELEKVKQALGENQFCRAVRAAKDVLELGYDSYTASERHLTSEAAVLRLVAIYESEEYAEHETATSN